MKVVVVNTMVPFLRGGAELVAEQLRDAIREEGHDAELLTLPYARHDPARIAADLESAQRWPLRGADRVIGLKFPTYLVPHEDKVVWIQHQHRPAYELFGTPFGMAATDGAARDLVRAADERMLREARSVHVTSETVRDRLRRFNGVDAPILHPPLGARGQYRAEDYGDYVFCPTRLSRAKRPDLLLTAMRHTRSRIRLVLAGTPVPRQEALRLRALVLRHRLRARVTLLPHWIGEDEKVRLYAHARAVAYVPFDEDYGFVPLEAAASERPVVTCTDSGGTHLVVADGASGRIVPPDPRALAAAFDELMDDEALARRLGAGARARLDALGLSWPAVARTLLA